MTQSTDRLDRIEALLERSIVQHNQEMAEIRAGLRETRNIADSNARSIQAYDARIEEGIAEAEEVSSSMAANTNNRMEQAIADTVAMIANLGQQQQESMQRHQESDQRFEVFLAEARADRKRFDEGLARADRDRALNESEHRAFRETFQTMLAQIAQLWQRVAG